MRFLSTGSWRRGISIVDNHLGVPKFGPRWEDKTGMANGETGQEYISILSKEFVNYSLRINCRWVMEIVNHSMWVLNK